MHWLTDLDSFYEWYTQPADNLIYQVVSLFEGGELTYPQAQGMLRMVREPILAGMADQPRAARIQAALAAAQRARWTGLVLRAQAWLADADTPALALQRFIPPAEGALSLPGHADAISALCFVPGHPPGRYLLSASHDGSLILWDGLTGQGVRTFTGHTAGVEAMAVSQDGAWIVSGSQSGEVRVWQVASGECLRAIPAHAGAVRAAAFHPDGRRFFTASHDHTLKGWDAATSELICTLRGHTDRVMDFAFLPGDDQLLSAGDDRTLRLWDVTRGELLSVFPVEGGFVSGLAVLDVERFITGSDDRILRRWDLASQQVNARWSGHEGTIRAMQLTPDRAHLLVGDNAGEVRLWSLAAGEWVRRFRGHRTPVTAVAVSGDGLWAATGSRDGALRLWPLIGGDGADHPPGHPQQGAINAIAVRADGQQWATASEDGSLALWGADAHTPLHLFAGESPTLCALFLPDGNLVSGHASGDLLCWRPGQESPRRLGTHRGGVLSLAWAGGRIWAGTETWAIKSWDPAGGDALPTLTGHRGGVQALAVTPDATRLLSAGEDGCVGLWDPVRGERLALFMAHDEVIAGLAVAGNRIFTGGDDGLIRAWSIGDGSGQLLAEVEAHEDWINDLLAVPGQGLLSAGQDGFLRWWDESLSQVQEIWLPTPPLSLGWLPRSQCLIVGDEQGNLSLFQLIDGGRLG